MRFVILIFFFFPMLLVAQVIDDQMYSKIDQALHLNEDQVRKSDLIINSSHLSKKSKVTHYYINQLHNGIEIKNAIMGIHLDSKGDLIHATGKPIKLSPRALKYKVSPIEALNMLYVEHSTLKKASFRETASPPLKNRYRLFVNKSVSQKEIATKLIYKFIEEDLVLCWSISYEHLDSEIWQNISVDANTGQIVDRTDWTLSCGHDSHQGSSHACNTEHRALPSKKAIKPNNIMTANYQVYPMPLESPADGARTIEVEPWINAPNASPFGWHDTNGMSGNETTSTAGNNVQAATDLDANNVPDLPILDGGSNLSFQFPIDLTMAPDTYIPAVVTNLFYWNNIVHDVMYEYGFDESSGNFQFNNYGNSGMDGDFVRAEAQDGSGTNNANFATPPDGMNPRMQMFIWNPETSTEFEVNGPASIQGEYTVTSASFGAQTGSYTGDLVLVNDDSAEVTEACGVIQNGSAISGNIALIDRGSCDFDFKVNNAESQGAIAAVVCNNTGGQPIGMGGDGDPVVNIPSVMITQDDCTLIKAELLNNTVNVTFSFDDTVVNTDSDLDNLIIVHEYGHGVSIRLTGGADNSGCLDNSEQMGEGWSDYLGLWLTMKASDTPTEGRAVGTYVLGQGDSDDGGGGIRPFPYSQDLTVNPHTYEDIANVSIPHGVGSVWCNMLWEMTWDLIAVYGFDADFYAGTGGNNIAMELVIEGLKLQGCSPGFVDGRDAILAADMAINNGANQCLIWGAFAKRGLGLSASQGDADNVNDSVEAYDVPQTCGTPGCTDPASETFNSMATVDNGSCTYCSDGVMNGDETGIDCGGSDSSCPACPTCTDGMMNGSETGVDCGGPACPTCPTCSDGMMNGSESGVDCGGSSCQACPCDQTNLTYTGPTNIPNGTNKKVDQKILMDGALGPVQVLSGSDVKLRAGQSIEIQPQFEIKFGAVVLLDIEPCN